MNVLKLIKFSNYGDFSQYTALLLAFFAISSARAYAAANDFHPRCSRQAKQIKLVISEEFGLKDTLVEIDAETICAVMASVKPDVIDVDISAVTAARRVIRSYLTDKTHIESPLAIATEIAFDSAGIPAREPVPREIAEAAEQLLREHLSSSRTSLRIIPAGETAEHGETSGPFWIFRMTARSLSDHIFYGVVARNGRPPVYNYGFN